MRMPKSKHIQLRMPKATRMQLRVPKATRIRFCSKTLEGFSLFMCFMLSLAVFLGFAFLPSLAFAQEAFTTIDTGNTAWMLTASALVLMMSIPGLALLYAGMVRKKNVLATLAQTFATCCLVSILWVSLGYTLAFSPGSGALAPFIGDFSLAFLSDASVWRPMILGEGSAHPLSLNIPEPVFLLFQMGFAIITPALIAGAFADRMKFSTTLVFMGLWALLVYAPLARWVWHPAGFLFNMGVLDFAGGAVVHLNAGIAGLVAAFMIGRRQGYPLANFTPHNLVLSFIGASLLWVGWLGFNAGSALAADGRAALAAAVTMAAGAAGGFCWMLSEWGIKHRPSVMGMLMGAVAGLVAITPAAGFVDLPAALIIGGLAGGLCYIGTAALKQALGYDDSLDCFGIHGIAGLLGALLTGLLAREKIGGVPGLLEGNAHQMLVQLMGVGVTILWCALVTALILWVLDKLMGLRVPADVEQEGLDLALHGERLE